MTEEEKEFYDQEQELLYKLDCYQAKLINHQIQIQELIDEPDDKSQELVALHIKMVEAIEAEIKRTNLSLEILALEKRNAELIKKRDKILAEENSKNQKTRNILLIGGTGSGKSTLGNVLVNKNGQFEEIFKESAGSVSQTKNIQVEIG